MAIPFPHEIVLFCNTCDQPITLTELPRGTNVPICGKCIKESMIELFGINQKKIEGSK